MLDVSPTMTIMKMTQISITNRLDTFKEICTAALVISICFKKRIPKFSGLNSKKDTNIHYKEARYF